MSNALLPVQRVTRTPPRSSAIATAHWHTPCDGGRSLLRAEWRIHNRAPWIGTWRTRCRWWRPLSSGCEHWRHWMAGFWQVRRRSRARDCSSSAYMYSCTERVSGLQTGNVKSVAVAWHAPGGPPCAPYQLRCLSRRDRAYTLYRTRASLQPGRLIQRCDAC